ncbi:hypothetical protein ACVWZZ_003789 [Bradyrhizobium sp. LM6.10]
MPPRLLISATASIALLVEVGPQIPGEPVKVRKLPMRSLSRAPRRFMKCASIGDRSKSVATGDRFRNSMDGGNAGPP